MQFPPLGPQHTRQPRSLQVSFVAWLAANRRHVATGASAAAVLYLLYRAYHSESASQLGKVQKSLRDFATTLATLSSTSALVLNDLHAFLTSDSDEIPCSLRQLNKLVQSRELQSTVAQTITTVGNALSRMSPTGGSVSTSHLLQQVLDAVLSDRGQTLVGIAVERATRNATVTFCEYLERTRQGSMAQHATADAAGAGDSASATLQAVMSLLSSERGERLLTLLITKSMRTAITSYVDATTGINYYNDMVASISPPAHREAVVDVMSRITTVFCREVVSAMRRPSTNQRAPSNAARRHAHLTTATTAALATVASTNTVSQQLYSLNNSRASSSTGSVISLAGHVGQPPSSSTNPTTSRLTRRSSADDALHLVSHSLSQATVASDRQTHVSGLPPLHPQLNGSVVRSPPLRGLLIPFSNQSQSKESATPSEMLRPGNVAAIVTTVGSLTHSSLQALVKEPALFKVMTAMISVGAYQAMKGTSEVFFSWLTLARVSLAFALMGATAVCLWIMIHASPAAAVRWLVTLASSGPSA